MFFDALLMDGDLNVRSWKTSNCEASTEAPKEESAPAAPAAEAGESGGNVAENTRVIQSSYALASTGTS